MGLLDYVAAPTQRVAYLFPELGANGTLNYSTSAGEGTSKVAFKNGGFAAGRNIRDVFIFQFWPQQVQDNYTPNYATKNIPGASHPLYQWTSGGGRDLSFTANFVSEINEAVADVDSQNTDFRTRLSGAAATSIRGVQSSTILNGAIGALALPSARYTVNVAAAIAALQQYLYPTYGTANDGAAIPPRKLVLVLPGTKLGRQDGADGILCIMRGASVTMESWFPDGTLRAASVALRFSEIVQLSNGTDVSKVRYIGAEVYSDLAQRYTATVTSPNSLYIN